MVYEYTAKSQFSYEEDLCYVRLDQLQKTGFPPHRHDYVELVIVLKGAGEHVVNDTIYPVSSGDIYVVQGNLAHAYQNVKDLWICNVMFKDLSLLFREDRLRRLPGYQSLFVIEPAYKQFRSRLQLSTIQLNDVQGLIQKIQEENARREPGYESMIQALLLQLVIFLSRAYEEDDGRQQGRYLRLGKALAYMQEEFRCDMSVDELAVKAGLSRRHFLRMFKQCFNTTPIEFVIHQRIQHAAQLLRLRRDLTVGEIAEESGFNDSNYFSRRFSRTYGLSPRAYRQFLDR